MFGRNHMGNSADHNYLLPSVEKYVSQESTDVAIENIKNLNLLSVRIEKQLKP